MAAGRRTETERFVQGLIQIAVACLKRHQGFIDVGRDKASQGLERFPRHARCGLGIVIQELRAAVEVSFFGDGSKLPVIRLKMSQK